MYTRTYDEEFTVVFSHGERNGTIAVIADPNQQRFGRIGWFRARVCKGKGLRCDSTRQNRKKNQLRDGFA
jgi:hypothetical protein